MMLKIGHILEWSGS